MSFHVCEPIGSGARDTAKPTAGQSSDPVLPFAPIGYGVRIFKTKWLVRFARREQVTDDGLKEAIARAARGIVEADLGGGIIKQRVARLGQGRSGGHRMLIAYRAGERAVFLYGFAKSERENIGPDELATLREIGAAWLAANAGEIAQALQENALQEVDDDDSNAT